jgi:hypothetical protein
MGLILPRVAPVALVHKLPSPSLRLSPCTGLLAGAFRDRAFRELFSDALPQRPTESVRDFMQRFPSALARLPPDSLDEAARIAAYVSHLYHQ